MTKPLYYAQNREDKWIAENLPLPDKGFYVDIGCGHPFTTSNTAFLRDRKWDGLAIDGSPIWADEWKDIPAFRCSVISSKEGPAAFRIDPDNAYWSRIDDNGSKRYARTIESVLPEESIDDIDFLSIDTEGTELEVIQSFDFYRHGPSIVVVEYNAAHLPIVEPNESPIPAFMRSKGYTMEHVFPPVNMIFAK
jgi:FkbM family methyltransferase